MKAIYWRPQTTSPQALLIIGFLSVAGLMWMFWQQTQTPHGPPADELVAANLANDCFRAIKAERQRLGHVIDDRFDPHQTGMIGEPISAATSKVANLSAKQVSVNPNFAAVVVRLLADAGVERGDTIAVGWSGSFPGLNVALCSAIETLDLKPIVIASALSSQYGANHEEFLWLDMEKHLAKTGLIRFRSSAMTVGGAADRAFGESHEVTSVAQRVHERTDVPWLEANKLRMSVDARIGLYEQLRKAQPLAAYINVGGGVASMGGSDAVNLRAGVNQRLGSLEQMPDCVAKRFALEGKPVVHLAHARTLAERYQLNTDLAQLPIAGVGAVFQQQQPSRLHAGFLLFSICGLLHAFVTRDYGYRALNWLMVPLRARASDRKGFRIVGEPVVSQLMV